MMQLTKQSTNEEVKLYFDSIMKLAKAKEEYPVNLDEVWPLVYSKKSDAVEALQRDFIENVDYKVLRQNPQNSQGGRPTNEYSLSVPCLEFFIARKVRSVFEVYRKVFHRVSKNLNQITIADKMKAATWVAKYLNLNECSKLMIAKQLLEPYGLLLPDYTPSKGILKSAGELLKENGYNISAQSFNQKMIENGYMEELTRPSSNGSVKKFKSIKGKGLDFGENQVNPNNPKSTQPLYYENKFIELLQLLKIA